MSAFVDGILAGLKQDEPQAGAAAAAPTQAPATPPADGAPQTTPPAATPPAAPAAGEKKSIFTYSEDFQKAMKEGVK